MKIRRLFPWVAANGAEGGGISDKDGLIKAVKLLKNRTIEKELSEYRHRCKSAR